jgi:hypothetical protein
MKPTIGMPERKHKLRSGELARQPDDDAVDRPLALHFDPISAAPSNIRAIRPLGDHPLDVGQR